MRTTWAAVLGIAGILAQGCGSGSGLNSDETVRSISEIPGDDDIATLGVPAQKTSWETGKAVGYQGDEPAETAFAYDEIGYVVRSRSLHGTKVTVAIHKTTVQAYAAVHGPERFAEAIFEMFHNIWHVFGGYPLDGYLFKVRSATDTFIFSLSQGGVVLPAKEYAHLDQAHEMIHAWNAKTFTYRPNGSDDLFQLETWIQEGATIYLANRIDGIAVGGGYYENHMEGLWLQYLELRAQGYDRSYEELAALASPTGMNGSRWGKMLDSRGNALNYLLDRELRMRGSSLSALLHRLYVRFGLAGVPYRQSDVEAALQDLTGESLRPLLDPYLRTDASLVPALEGGFPFLGN